MSASPAGDDGGAGTFDCPAVTQSAVVVPVPEALRAAETEVRRALPLSSRIGQAWLMTGGTASGSWRQVAALPLRTPG